MIRERERGSESRRIRGRESDDGHRDISLEPLRGSTGLFCLSMFGWQITSGLTCDMLSWNTERTQKTKSRFSKNITVTTFTCFFYARGTVRVVKSDYIEYDTEH